MVFQDIGPSGCAAPWRSRLAPNKYQESGSDCAIRSGIRRVSPGSRSSIKYNSSIVSASSRKRTTTQCASRLGIGSKCHAETKWSGMIFTPRICSVARGSMAAILPRFVSNTIRPVHRENVTRASPFVPLANGNGRISTWAAGGSYLESSILTSSESAIISRIRRAYRSKCGRSSRGAPPTMFCPVSSASTSAESMTACCAAINSFSTSIRGVANRAAKASEFTTAPTAGCLVFLCELTLPSIRSSHSAASALSA